MEQVTAIIAKVSYYSVIPPLLLGLVLLIKGKITKRNIPILLLLALSIVCDILGRWAAAEFKNNMPVSHFYSFGLTALIILFFYRNFYRWNKMILGLGSIYLVYYILNSLFYETILAFNPIARILQALMIIPICLLFFYSVYKFELVDNLEKSSSFWIVVGIFTYYSGAFFTFLFSYKILNLPETSLIGSWVIHNIANALKNVFFLISFIVIYKYE